MGRHLRLRNIITTLLIGAAPFTSSSLGADEPFDYFSNSWTVIGLKDYTFGTRITPDSRLVIRDENNKPSNVLIRFGRELNPLTAKMTKILMDGWLPIVH